MPPYRTHLVNGEVDSVEVDNRPYSFICKQLGNGQIHVTRVNRETGDTLPPIDLYLDEFPEAICRILKKIYHL